jgi:pimeloyl-ACP methyl ester carboxylesterase
MVPGFYFGGWVFEEVADRLRAAGHEVHLVELTGQGERAAEATPEITHRTQEEDILALIEGRDLREVVLVVHSGGTVPATGFADRFPERLRRIVYVDTAPFPDGMAQIDFLPPELQAEQRRQIAEEGGGFLLPPRPFDAADQESDPISLAGLSADDLARMREHATPQPAALVLTPVSRPAEVPATPKTMVTCCIPLEQVRKMIGTVPSFSMLQGEEWTFVELPTGHWPMLSRPRELAEILLEV